LIGVGPKLAIVPYLKVTAGLDAATRAAVRRKMLITVATTALALVVLGELLRKLLHFSVGSLSIAGGVILLVLAVRMVMEQPDEDGANLGGADPMRLAMVPLAVPYLLNPVGIVGLITISAEAESASVLAAEITILVAVLLFDALVFYSMDRTSAGLNQERMLVVEKVFGFLIAAIAVQLILDGLHSVGAIAHLPH
jgi:multiple antibiotic resistance protein